MSVGTVAIKRETDDSDQYLASKRLRCNMSDGPTFYSWPLTVLIGKSEDKFLVHQPHVCASSKYFEKIFSDDKIETTNHTTPNGQNGANATKSAPSFKTPNLADALIDMAVDKMATDVAYYIEIANVIYPHTAPRSRHRKFAVDLAVHLWDDNDFKELPKQDAPKDFLTDLLKCVGIKMRRDAIMVEDVDRYFEDMGEYDDPCKYHEHSKKKGSCHKEKRNFVFEQPA
ncbi:hypothetical protein CC86DRAFT_405169 [Ophiobolus disseminans]|uniref:BTB domain-containing protein n=1 Tax=Ophiobolus disseminans TaxID=1469910 RepID=A0A6A7A4T6_9PLEO|nr:hypothetical protein CC86DRAFT_405169 [Ophiobolus disseminans]